MFDVRVHEKVLKGLKKLPKAHRIRFTKFIEMLENNPIPADVFDIKKVVGQKSKSRYRLRLGNYRIFYEIHWDERIVLILKIEARKKAYLR